MKNFGAYVHAAAGRERVSSVQSFLSRSVMVGHLMDSALMRANEKDRCRWINYGIGKGVTNPEARISIFAVPTELKSGLHAELVDGLGIHVDRAPLCYDEAHHVHGFGGFIRWVYFADPKNGKNFLGIDWSLSARVTAGIATSMVDVVNVADVLMRHGIPPDTELVLLNSRMCEEEYHYAFRKKYNLITLNDWTTRGDLLFSKPSTHCPRCGLRTFMRSARYCFRCGANPKLFWKRRTSWHGDPVQVTTR